MLVGMEMGLGLGLGWGDAGRWLRCTWNLPKWTGFVSLEIVAA